MGDLDKSIGAMKHMGEEQVRASGSDEMQRSQNDGTL